MRVDGTTIFDMFEVLRLKVVVTSSPPKIIRFKDVGGNTLCDVGFDDIEEDTTVPGDFYFQDQFDSRIIRGIVALAGTITEFEIYDGSGTPEIMISGNVGLLNSGSDIEFNAIDWEVDQVVIISSLKIIFPPES